MQWIIDAIKANTDTDGKVNLDQLAAAIKTDFPKHAVPKEQYNTASDKLKAANDTLGKLQKENKDLSGLQTQIDDYKKQVTDLETNHKTFVRDAALMDALRASKAKDADYTAFKIRDKLTVGKDGMYENIEGVIKSSRETNADWYEADKAPAPPAPSMGYKPFDTKLASAPLIDQNAQLDAQIAASLGIPNTIPTNE